MPRPGRRQQRWNAVHGANRRAVLVSFFAALMMAIVVEIYYADLMPDGAPTPRKAHLQAFAAACAGFLPALLCLERLNSGSWSRAVRLTAPWLLLIPEALMASLYQPRWYLLVAMTLSCGIAAYLAMLRIARHPPRA